MLANGREHWSPGERIYVSRRSQGRAGLWLEPPADEVAEAAELAVTKPTPTFETTTPSTT